MSCPQPNLVRVVADLFESAIEAADELNKWENKDEFKIDKI